MNKNLDRVAMEQNALNAKLPDQVQYIRLNASSVGKSSGTKEVQEFGQLIDALKLGVPVIPKDKPPSTPSAILLNLPDGWATDPTIVESVSYEPVINALSASGYHAYDVSHGQNLFRKLLFDQNIWTLRQFDAIGLRQDVLMIGSLKGRVDIVVLSSPLTSQHILRHMVRFAIEIKCPSAMKSPSNRQNCVREAMAQLIGLCACNPNNSPSVILTDLANCYYVLFLTKDAGEHLKYYAKLETLTNFGSCVETAFIHSEAVISKNFGRGPSPNLSERYDLHHEEDTDSDLFQLDDTLPADTNLNP